MTYPTISHFIENLTGFFIPLPIQTFGFFIVVAFFMAHFFIKKEFLRLESLGRLKKINTTHTHNLITLVFDYIFNGLMSFLFGYKIIYIINNYQAFTTHPQKILLSSDGNLLIGLLCIIASTIYIYKYHKENRNIKPELFPSELSWNFIFVAGLSGIIGAKLFAVLEDFNYFIQDPLGALFSFSGLTFYGGLIFGTIAIIIYGKKNNIKISYLSDIFAPSLILAYGIGRLGCHFSGDGDWGVVSDMNNKPDFIPDWFWGYNFPHNVIEAGVKIEGCVGKYCNELPYLVYPTSLYEACFGIIGFMFLYILRNKIKIPGTLFCIYLFLNGIERFLIEKIRITEKYNILGYNLTQAQIIALLIMIIGIMMLIYLKRKYVPIKK